MVKGPGDRQLVIGTKGPAESRNVLPGDNRLIVPHFATDNLSFVICHLSFYCGVAAVILHPGISRSNRSGPAGE
jgi:hypothetical protein